MPTLHMEVDIARSTQQTMAHNIDEMRMALQNMQSAINNLRAGAWQGNSATEFFNQYDPLQTKLDNTLQELHMLSTRLQKEISEWEAAAANL